MHFKLFTLVFFIGICPALLTSQVNDEKIIFVDQENIYLEELDNVEVIKDTTAIELPITRELKIGDGIYRIKSGNFYGIEVNGEIKIPPIYNKLQLEYKPYMEASKGNWGIISSNNEIIIPFIYGKATLDYKYNTVLVCTPGKDKLCGIVDLQNKPIVPLIYKAGCRSTRFSKYPNIAYSCNDFKQTFFYDSAGVLISEHPFSSIYEIDEDYYIVHAGEEHWLGISDSEFNLIVQPTYDMHHWIYKNYICMRYTKENTTYNVIIDLVDVSIKLDLSGSFTKPDENGIFYYEYYKDNKLIKEQLDINKLGL